MPSKYSTTQIMPLTLAGPSYTTRSKDVHMQSTVNWYPEISGYGDDKEMVLYPTPGTILLSQTGSGPHRGAIEFNGNGYFVSGNTLYQMDILETIRNVGTINTYSGRVSMATNGTQGNQLMLVDGTDGWIYDGTTLTQISDAQFPANPNIVAFKNSYFIVIPDNSSLFYISNSNDGTGWEALDFASAEQDPDNIVTVVANEDELVFLGERTTERWAITNGEFPFERYGNGTKAVGCDARFSALEAVGSTIFLAQDKHGKDRVVMMSGASWKPISSKALEYQLSTYSRTDDAYAGIYSQAGHMFYVLTFPTADKTWVYDMDIGDPDLAWHERSTDGGAWLMASILFYNDKIYVGDRSTPNLYILDLNTYKDGTKTIKRERTGTHLKKFRNRIRFVKLEIDVERGTGLIDGQGSDSKMMIEWSTNHGHTFDNKRYVSGPNIGEYYKRILVHHLGAHRDLVIRITVSDPINWVIKGAYLHYMELAH